MIFGTDKFITNRKSLWLKLRLMDAELISLNQGHSSLEEFFMEQMELHGIRSSS